MLQTVPAETLRKLAEPLVLQLGMQLLDVSWSPSRGGATLRLTVDRPGGVTVADCGQVSEALSALLDRRAELLPDHYALEVSSPGAERELRTEEDYGAALGRKVRVEVGGDAAVTILEGRLVAVGGEQLELEVKQPKSGRRRSVVLDRRSVSQARVWVDL